MAYTVTLKSNDTHFAQDLVRLNTKYEQTIYIKKGPYIVDGKSILGVLSLGGLDGATLYCEKPEQEFVEDMFLLLK